MRRNIIYGLMIVPMAVLLVSCFADYENIQIRPSAESYIDYLGDDRISVNLMGMNESQLDEVQTQLTEIDIDLNYINREFDSEGIIERIEFEVFFPNGSSGKAKAEYTTYGVNHHGFGAYLNSGGISIGSFGAQYDPQKYSTYDKMAAHRNKGAKYFIEDREVSFEDAVDWFDNTEYWQTNVSSDNPETGALTFRLESSIKNTWNPFKKASTFLRNGNALKEKFFGNAIIVIEEAGKQTTYPNFQALSSYDKARIPGPIDMEDAAIEPLNSNMVLYDVAQGNLYTRRFENGKEVPLLSDL